MLYHAFLFVLSDLKISNLYGTLIIYVYNNNKIIKGRKSEGGEKSKITTKHLN